MTVPILVALLGLATVVLTVAALLWSGYRAKRDVQRRIDRRTVEYARRRDRGVPWGIG